MRDFIIELIRKWDARNGEVVLKCYREIGKKKRRLPEISGEMLHTVT